MVKRNASAPDTEPEQVAFDLPSEKEHLFQVSDLFTMDDEGNKFNLDPNTVIAKCEVVGGKEEGRTLLQRVSLDDQWKGFFATKLFLKAIGEPYKGQDFPIDTDNWQARQFYATVIHNKSKDGNKTFANIKEYNFDKLIKPTDKPASDEVAWDDPK